MLKVEQIEDRFHYVCNIARVDSEIFIMLLILKNRVIPKSIAKECV